MEDDKKVQKKREDTKEPAKSKRTPSGGNAENQRQGAAKPSFWKERFVPFWMRNKKRNLKIFLAVLAALILVVAIVAGFYVNNLLNLIGPDDPDQPNNGVEDELYDENNFTEMDGITDAASLKDLMKKWATNGGELYSSRNVINVLLIGQDAGRSDSMILLSLNKKTDKITLASFFRDSYTYINYRGKDNYTKINAAYAWGGPNLLIETLQNNFKIKIDHYVTINFENFSKAIDAIGGVYVDVQPYESSFLRRTTDYKNFPVGEHVLLNGEEALTFSRMRYSDADADISRTRRQRQVISALIQQSKSASVSQLDDLANKLFPYVNTNFSKSEILSLGSQAIISGWMNYPINPITVPSSEFREGKTIGGTSFIIVDYQAAAYELQMALYGNSNIPMDDHVSPFDLDLSSSGRTNSNAGNGNGSSSANKASTNSQQATRTPYEDRTSTPAVSNETPSRQVTKPPETTEASTRQEQTTAWEEPSGENGLLN